MPDEPKYSDFLKDAAVYDQAECYWSRLLARPGWRAGWLTTSFADGTRFRDGNPIASAIHVVNSRAVRIIQVEFGHVPRLCGWTRTMETEWGEVEELVVHVVATAQTIVRARRALAVWMDDGDSAAALHWLDGGTIATNSRGS